MTIERYRIHMESLNNRREPDCGLIARYKIETSRFMNQVTCRICQERLIKQWGFTGNDLAEAKALFKWKDKPTY